MSLSPLRLGARFVAALGVVALFAVFAAPASAAKVTWRGIGPVKLGMSDDELQKKLGEPSTVDDGSAAGARFYGYPRHKFRIAISDGRVVAVQSTSRAHRTRWGIQVGSSYREMRRRVRGESCGKASGQRVCSVARGKSVIGFASRHGRVVLVEVGRVG